MKKINQWEAFSKEMQSHIKEYANKQYGDFPDKTIAKYDIVKIQAKLEAYVDRIGKGARGKDEEIRDCLKIAHFACYLFNLLKYGNAQHTIF
jgi:hypothetical protein